MSVVNATESGIGTPGSKRTFSRRSRNRRPFSSRALQRATACPLFWASRIAMVVPQAPSPRTANLIGMVNVSRSRQRGTRNTGIANYYRNDEKAHPAVKSKLAADKGGLSQAKTGNSQVGGPAEPMDDERRVSHSIERAGKENASPLQASLFSGGSQTRAKQALSARGCRRIRHGGAASCLSLIARRSLDGAAGARG